MWLILVNAANSPTNPGFDGQARTFFMWMAIIALVVTWAWLYLRIRKRMNDPRPQPPTENPPAEPPPAD
jgi:hypothetical protein